MKHRRILKSSGFLYCAFAAVVAYMYLNLFNIHSIPILISGDQTYFWEYAFRMFQGEHVYRGFFQFTPPGTDIFYLALLKLCGPHLWVVNLGLMLLGCGLFAVCFSIARCLMSRTQALLSTVIIIVFLFGERLDGTHHWFSLVLSLCALRIILTKRTPLRMIFSGAALGAASFFTQTAGVAALLGLSAALFWEHFAYKESYKRTTQNILLLAAAAGLAWTILSAPFIADVGWRKLFYFQVTYPRLYVKNGWSSDLPNVRGMFHSGIHPRLLLGLFVYFSLAIYLPILWCCWRKRNVVDRSQNVRVVFLALLGFFLMLGVITRANTIRIFAVAPPAVLLLGWLITRLKNDSLQRFVSIGAVIAVSCLAASQIHGRQHGQYTVVELPSGTMALPARQYEEYSWIMHHTSPGDYFFESNWLDMYFPLALRDPIFAEGLMPKERPRPEMVALTVTQVEEKQVRYVLWAPQWAGSIEDPSPPLDCLTPLRTYLKTHYVRAFIFSNHDEVWERR